MEQKSPSQNNWFSQFWRAIRVPFLAILMALVVGAVILMISGANPITAYVALFRGAFGNANYIKRTLEKTTPLIFSGLAVAFAFKAGLFNIGAQGQLLMGAITSGFLGFAIKGLPPVIHIPVALMGGCLAGALYGAIPGLLRAYSGAHEVITSIMLNYIAINITDYLSNGPWKDTSGINVIARLPMVENSAKIPYIGPVPVGLLIAILIAFIIWYILEKTNFGFEIRSVGLNADASRYAGMKTKFLITSALVVGGLLAGFGGSVETLGVVGRFQPGFNSGIGFDGITVALLGRSSPFGVILSSFLLGALKGGANVMQFDAKVPHEIIDVIQGLMLFFVTADLLVRKFFRIKKDSGMEVHVTAGWGQK